MYDVSEEYQRAARFEGDVTRMPDLERMFTSGIDEYRRWSAFDYERNARVAFMEDVVRNFSQSTGVAVENPERSVWEEGFSLDMGGPKFARYDKVRATFEANGWAFPSDEEIDQQAKAYSAKARSDFQELQAQKEQAGGSFMLSAAGMVGTVAGSLTDPVMLPTMFMGASAASGILRTAGIEALLNAGVQTANEALFFGARKEMAPDYNAAEAMQNIAMAGAGGAVIGGGVKAIARGVNWLRGRKDAPPLPQDVIDAARVQEAEDLMLDGNAFGDSVEGYTAHVQAYSKALDQAARGEPVDVADITSRAPLPTKQELTVSQLTQQAADETAKALKRALPKPPTGKTLFQFLAEKGGVRDDGGELLFLDLQGVTLRGKNNRKLALVNDKGLSLDEARRLAEEAGYITPADRLEAFGRTEVNDLLAALEREGRGSPVYTLEKQAEWDAYDLARRQFDEQVQLVKTAPQAIDETLKALFRGTEDSVPLAVRKLAMRKIAEGVDTDTAVDDALEAWARQTFTPDVRLPEEDIPFVGEGGEIAPGLPRMPEDIPAKELEPAVAMESNRVQAEALLGGRKLDILDDDGNTVDAADYLAALDAQEKEIAELFVCVVGDMTEGAV